jgi:L-alanine-DL-glutamate epimerase-like enolase superfamily enzyme
MLQKLEQAAEYPILKIKVGSSEDLDILQTIWDTSHKPMYIDANEGWTLQQALEYLPKLEAMGVQMVEQPFKRDDYTSYQIICQENPTNVPIMIDEGVQGPDDVEQWVGKTNGVNVKLAKCGGITRALQVIEQAKKFDMKVMLGCMIESSLAVTAAAHLTSLVDFIDLDGAELISNDPFDGMKFINRFIELPNRPGIGAVPLETY